MSQITISFVPSWLEEQRTSGTRVVRQLEKWVAALETVTLKTSSGSSLTVELQPAAREKFIKGLALQMKRFGETRPWTHTKFSGDLGGLDLPTSWPEPEASAEASGKSAGQAKPAEPAGAGTGQEPQLKAEKDPEPEAAATEGPRKTLEDICSRAPVKYSRELAAYLRETAEVIPTLQKMGVESTLWHQHLLLAVDEGYGRSEFLSALARLFKACGLVKGELDKSSVREFILLPKGREQEEDGYRVGWDKVLDMAQEMNRTNTRNGISKVVLYIDVSAWQISLTSRESKIRLRRLNSLCGTFLVVFRIPFVEGHVLRETAEALNDILNVRPIAVPPVPLGDMIDYARGELATSGFRIADDALPAFEQWVLHEKTDESFFGYKTMDKVVQKLIYEKALSNCRRKKQDRHADLRLPEEIQQQHGGGNEEIHHAHFRERRIHTPGDLPGEDRKACENQHRRGHQPQRGRFRPPEKSSYQQMPRPSVHHFPGPIG